MPYIWRKWSRGTCRGHPFIKGGTKCDVWFILLKKSVSFYCSFCKFSSLKQGVCSIILQFDCNFDYYFGSNCTYIWQIGRSKWNGQVGSSGVVVTLETPLNNIGRPSLSVQLNGGFEIWSPAQELYIPLYITPPLILMFHPCWDSVHRPDTCMRMQLVFVAIGLDLANQPVYYICRQWLPYFPKRLVKQSRVKALPFGSRDKISWSLVSSTLVRRL